MKSYTITIVSLCLMLHITVTQCHFQLNGLEESILRSLLKFRGFRVKLFEYFHESLSIPILSFLLRDRRSVPRNILTLLELAKLAKSPSTKTAINLLNIIKFLHYIKKL